jgi:hypothetical protein
MSDAVFDTSVVAYANSDIVNRKLGGALDQRLILLEGAATRKVRIRYNDKLILEYAQHVRRCRNDVIELFFAVLDSAAAVRAPRNTLSRQHHQLADALRWPCHDEHLLAAAIGGDSPSIYVTEEQLARPAAEVFRIFRIHVHLV